jgi:hypothetical protein
MVALEIYGTSAIGKSSMETPDDKFTPTWPSSPGPPAVRTMDVN